MLKPGLYEQLITRQIQDELDRLSSERAVVAPLPQHDASRVLSSYLAEVLRHELDRIAKSGGSLSDQIGLLNQVLRDIQDHSRSSEITGADVVDPGSQLLSVLGISEQSQTALDRPETSMARSTIFTGSASEPQLYSELCKEIRSANSIKMLMSFIRWSGLNLLMDDLRRFTENGGLLQVITTTYLGATDPAAVRQLAALPNTQVRVSYDTQHTRLHAKAYLFYRDTGFTTAYVGSSNMSKVAMSSGLEWNIKVSAQDLPDTIQKIQASFSANWNAKEFELYDETQEQRLEAAIRNERKQSVGHTGQAAITLAIQPHPFQQKILDKLQTEREVYGRNRNLIVAATGTGKTVIAALDYRRFRESVLQQNTASSSADGQGDTESGTLSKLLFVAHREEILKQSRSTFARVLNIPDFGELWTGGNRPRLLNHLFVSVQTLNSQSLWERLPYDFYDFIVVDEFHHAVAPTYQKLLAHFQPKILLGLTATPERMDGKSILDYFGGRIAAEIRLPEAIDRKLLCPFQYFGVADSVDLSGLRWTRGGYDVSQLDNLYVFTREIAVRRSDLIVRSLLRYRPDIEDVKGLGFCVSVDHANFMAEQFNRHGISSLALTGSSPARERNAAKQKLISGAVHFIFAVDIYNEGVDIPEVNTVLLLRPTESLTVFLQQLGRGLRLSEGKDCLTVLDFIGQANKQYNFEEKYAALMARTHRHVIDEVRNGFSSLPSGCYIRLQEEAQAAILDNLRQYFSASTRSRLISRIASFEHDTDLPLSLGNFLGHYRMDPLTIYSEDSFSRLCVLAKVRNDFDEPLEGVFLKGVRRLCSANSRRWIRFLLKYLPRLAVLDPMSLSTEGRQMLHMFYATMWNTGVSDWSDPQVRDHLRLLGEDCPVLIAELKDLLEHMYSNIDEDFVQVPADLGYPCSLDLHCSYTRFQALAALGCVPSRRDNIGVKWLPEIQTDILFVTLNKSEKDFSPTTQYEDYAINSELFHWQSQNQSSPEKGAGLRYIHHKEQDSNVLLFVRNEKTMNGVGVPFTYLGPVSYVSHTGEKPMSIIWKLENAIPAEFLPKERNATVV